MIVLSLWVSYVILISITWVCDFNCFLTTQLYQTGRFYSIFILAIIEISRCIGSYSYAKFELTNLGLRRIKMKNMMSLIDEYRKKEVFRYLIWGILSAMLNIGLFQLLTVIANMDYRIANAFTLIAVKVFSYITNKVFVFRTSCFELSLVLKEVYSFFLARGFTFMIDFAGVIVMVEFWRCDEFLSKCIMAFVVIILNYVLSKRFVFH